MAEYKNQHHLAQSYLAGFSPGSFYNDPVIWVGNLESKTIKIRSIEKTASRSYMYSFLFSSGEYDHRIEKAFGQLEHLYPDTIRRIKRSIESVNFEDPTSAITPKDHQIFCEYLFINVCRNPRVIDWMKNKSDTHNKRMREKGFEDAIESSSSNLAVMGLHKILTGKSEAIDILMSKNMKISFPVRRSSAVITCDDPVIRLRDSGGSGIIYDDTRIMFPLFSRAFLTLHGPGEELALEKIHDLSFVDRFNRFIVQNAYKEVYGSSPEAIMKALDDKEGWTVKKQPMEFDEDR